MEAGISVGVEEAGLGDKDRLGITNRAGKVITQVGIVFGMCLDRESMNGKL